MTLGNSLSHQLDFDLNLAAITTATSRVRSKRPNRTTKKRSAPDDRQTTFSMMNSENLLALMQVPSLTKLIGKYTGASETSPRSVAPVSAAEAHEKEEEIFHDATDVAEAESNEARGEQGAQNGAEARTTAKPAADWQLECKYTLSEVQQHNSLDDCWMVIFDKVYNITDFVHEHPGGDFILYEYAGRDATHPFLSSRHGSSAYKMLDKYWIGILVDEELYYSNNSSYCSVYLDLSWRSTPTLEETTSSSSGSSSSSLSSGSAG